jgi:hypothetical protein
MHCSVTPTGTGWSKALQAVADLHYSTVSKPISDVDAARRQQHIDTVVRLRGALLRTHDRRDVRIHIREARIKTTAALMERMMHDPPYNDLNIDAVLEVAFRRQDIERIYGSLPTKVLREIVAMKRDQWMEQLETGQAGRGIARYLGDECNDIDLLIASRESSRDTL